MDYKEMFGIDYNEDMTLENFYKVQHELPWFGFPLEDEKKDPVGDFKKICNKRDNAEKLTVKEMSKLIYANIFGSFGQQIDLDKAEKDALTLLKDVESNKPDDLEDDESYFPWIIDWQRVQVLLGTIYAYKKEFIKSAYHFMAYGVNDNFLCLEALALKLPYYDFIYFVLDQLKDIKPKKIKYTGCGFSSDNPMGAYKQNKEAYLNPYSALYTFSRMVGKNGEVIAVVQDGRFTRGYIKRECSVGFNATNTGMIDKYKVLIINKNYDVLETELYYDGYFEDVYGGVKTNCKIADGFTVRGPVLSNYSTRYVTSDESVITRS